MLCLPGPSEKPPQFGPQPMKPWVANYSTHQWDSPVRAQPICVRCGVCVDDHDFDAEVCDRNTGVDTDDKDEEPRHASQC